MRQSWIEKRHGDATPTQLCYARRGIVTEEMEYIAQRERCPAEFVRSETRKWGTLIRSAGIKAD